MWTLHILQQISKKFAIEPLSSFAKWLRVVLGIRSFGHGPASASSPTTTMGVNMETVKHIFMVTPMLTLLLDNVDCSSQHYLVVATAMRVNNNMDTRFYCGLFSLLNQSCLQKQLQKWHKLLVFYIHSCHVQNEKCCSQPKTNSDNYIWLPFESQYSSPMGKYF